VYGLVLMLPVTTPPMVIVPQEEPLPPPMLLGALLPFVAVTRVTVFITYGN